VSRDTNFYYSFLVLPPEKRRAIIAVWDFCRVVDDSVDEAASSTDPQVAAQELARWREELARCFDRRPPETAEGRALQPLIDRFGLPRSAFDALIEGVEMDLYPRRYATFDELYEYCIRVASAVGLMCIEIFGYTNPATRQYAVDLGVALQLTNILRDVPGDLAQGRLYLPLADLAQHGCCESDLQREVKNGGGGVHSPAVKRLLASQARRARDYYARAAAALPGEDRRRLVAAQIMGAIYRGILTRIEAAQYDVFSQVIRVPRPERALIAARIWLRTVALGR
jgi:phytoene synthase